MKASTSAKTQAFQDALQDALQDRMSKSPLVKKAAVLRTLLDKMEACQDFTIPTRLRTFERSAKFLKHLTQKNSALLLELSKISVPGPKQYVYQSADLITKYSLLCALATRYVECHQAIVPGNIPAVNDAQAANDAQSSRRPSCQIKKYNQNNVWDKSRGARQLIHDENDDFIAAPLETDNAGEGFAQSSQPWKPSGTSERKT